MPGLSSLFGKSGAVLGKIFSGKSRSVVRDSMQKIGVKWAGRAPLMTAASAYDATAFLSNRFMRAGAKTISYAGRHPMAATTIGMGVMTTTGIVRGIMGASRAMVPTPLPQRRQATGSGPGYVGWSASRGIPDTGASGDLALALHKVRHR
jgi:hypothetical protein